MATADLPSGAGAHCEGWAGGGTAGDRPVARCHNPAKSKIISANLSKPPLKVGQNSQSPTPQAPQTQPPSRPLTPDGIQYPF
ncbi:hypothetical protein [Leptolyngbya sp. O-77]|uniref:hypothetical protein n=1 Tax=Leptolyngbya sp. O-77 TaxID=1080068 RepID=UPI000AF8EA12|nr:hypothetical protein [Leptolyngbya sp. O-77]